MTIEPRSMELIREELNDLTEVIKVNRQFVDVYQDDPSLKIGLDSLLERQTEILEEIQEYNRRVGLESLDLSIDGIGVKNNEITVSYLCEFLNPFQDLVDLLAYIKTIGIPAETGSLPLNVRNSTALVFQAKATGSFKAILKTNRPELTDSLLKQGLVLFNELINAGDNEEQLRQIHRRIGNRTINKYREVLDVIRKHKGKVSFYDDVRIDNFQPTYINTEMAERIIKTIDMKISKTPIILEYQGTLKAVDHLKNIIKLDIGEDGVIEADFNSGLINAVNTYIYKECIAKFSVTEIYSSTIEQTKPHYDLIELRTV